MLPFNSVILSTHLSFVRTIAGNSLSLLHFFFFYFLFIYCFCTVLFWLPPGLPEELLECCQEHPPSTARTVLLGSHAKVSPSLGLAHPCSWPDFTLLL